MGAPTTPMTVAVSRALPCATKAMFPFTSADAPDVISATTSVNGRRATPVWNVRVIPTCPADATLPTCSRMSVPATV